MIQLSLKNLIRSFTKGQIRGDTIYKLAIIANHKNLLEKYFKKWSDKINNVQSCDFFYIDRDTCSLNFHNPYFFPWFHTGICAGICVKECEDIEPMPSICRVLCSTHGPRRILKKKKCMLMSVTSVPRVMRYTPWDLRLLLNA